MKTEARWTFDSYRLHLTFPVKVKSHRETIKLVHQCQVHKGEILEGDGS